MRNKKPVAYAADFFAFERRMAFCLRLPASWTLRSSFQAVRTCFRFPGIEDNEFTQQDNAPSVFRQTKRDRVYYPCMDSVFATTVDVIQWVSPGNVLFVATLVLFGSAFTLSFLIGSKPSVVKPLTGCLLVILFLLLGTVAIEFSAAATPSYTFGEFASLSEALSTHRWLIFQLPILLVLMNLMILHVYGERIAERHAVPYRVAVILSIAISFAALLAIGLESMI